MQFKNEFEKYAVNHLGLTTSAIGYYDKQIQSSLTPYILEERELRVTQMDIFSRMMLDRIIHVYGTVNDNMASIVQAQLMFLDNLEIKDIRLHCSTGGGSVLSGLGMVDVMNYVNSDIVTMNMGLCASMGSILLSSGTKGKRFSLKHSRTMLHTVSSGAQGVIADMQISLKEAEKYNDILFDMLSTNSGKDKETILNDCIRDFWLSSTEAKAYGLIDDIILTKPKKK